MRCFRLVLLLFAVVCVDRAVAFVQPTLQVSQIRVHTAAPSAARHCSSVQLRAVQDEAADSVAAFVEPPANKTIDIASQLSQYYALSLPFFKEERNAKILLAGLLALTLANSGVSVAFSYIGRDFWTALSQKNEPEFQIMLQKFLGALVAGVPVTVFYRFQREKLALAWREWMTTRVMDIYYSGQTVSRASC
jgi:ABC-type uncharacterized transport system fused permease/ATPase subunit